MKIRIEMSSLASRQRSGVAHYTRLLSEAFAKNSDIISYGHYFNFLNRQPKPALSSEPDCSEENKLFPLRIYAKAQSFGIAPPFDIGLPRVDLTIFPNFATWPTIHSRFTSTVVHDLTYIYFPEAVEDKNLAHLRRTVPRSIKKADFVITVSESVKAEIVKELGLDPEKCIVTPIPPDNSFFSKISRDDIALVKNKYKIGSGKKYIYFIGNLEPRKNLLTLVKAYSLLPKSLKETYSLVIAGGRGWKTEETEKAIKEAQKNGEDIKIIGYVDQEDSPALYQGASLFVFPSFYEGFGMPITESLASGCPIVASDIPVLREVGGDSIEYADPMNPRSFAVSIERVLASPRPSRDFLNKQVLKYSWEQNVEKIINYTKSLL